MLRAALFALLVAGTATAECVEPCPAWSGAIAYVTPLGQVAVVDPTQGEPTLLSPIGQRYLFPAFAPSGAEVAAVGFADGEGLVGVFTPDGADEAYRSAPRPPIYLYWAPDGASISFIAADDERGLGFYIADRGSTARLVETGSPFYWAWERDATSFLAHVGLTGDAARLAFGDPETGFGEGNLGPPGFFQAPGISPSGRFIAYATEAPGGVRRVVVASHPGVAGEVIERELGHQGFAMLGWSPTADTLAVLAPVQPAAHWFGPLRLLDAADGLLEFVMDEVALAFFWSPDGERLAWLSPVPESGVQQASQSRSAQRPPVQLRLRVAEVDGVESGAPRTLATFTPSPTFVDQFLPFFDQYALSHRIWAPGSDALAVPAVGRDGVTRIVVARLDGSVQDVAQGDMPSWNVR